MKSLREYIDLVERYLEDLPKNDTDTADEPTAAPKPKKQEVEPGDNPFKFGKKKNEVPKAEPSYDDKKKIADMKKHKSAEAYALAQNSNTPTNVDPPHIKKKANDEHNQLKADWSHFKKQGHF